MFIKKYSVGIQSTKAVTYGFTTNLHTGGYLQGIVWKSTAGKPSSGMKASISRDSSADRILFFGNKLSTAGTKYPSVLLSAASSTQLSARPTSDGGHGLIPIGSSQRIKVNLSAGTSVGNPYLHFDFYIGG